MNERKTPEKNEVAGRKAFSSRQRYTILTLTRLVTFCLLSLVVQKYPVQAIEEASKFDLGKSHDEYSSLSIQPRNDHFLIFSEMPLGQGAGNQMQGLLAAHLLGLDFGRTVCIDGFQDFLDAFHMVNDSTKELCDKIIQEEYSKNNESPTITLINFMAKPDECDLYDRLASEERVVRYIGNTYPGGWRSVPEKFFFRFYRPSSHLLDTLPFAIDDPPSTVVHLRAPDNSRDIRQGLDEGTLNALGEVLPSNTYLVTNQIAYHSIFDKEYGWRTPNWKDPIAHSALSISWEEGESVDGSNNRSNAFTDKKFGSTLPNETSSTTKKEGNLRLWADWLSCLLADKLYHTHSDFSASAAHWNSALAEQSKKIAGLDEHTRSLLLQQEDFLPSAIPFAQRQDPRKANDGADRSSLQNCAMDYSRDHAWRETSNSHAFAPMVAPDREAPKIMIKIGR